MNYKKLLFGTSIICGIALTLVALVPDRIQGMLNSNILTSSYGSDTCTSATKDGITWTFNARPCGTYVNGDWWVVGPVTITGISPLPTTGLNGTVINPRVGTSEQGFDNRLWANAYIDSLNVGKNLPLTVAVDSSVVSSISDPTNPQFGKIKMIGILTVVGSAPTSGSFRPSPYSSGVGSKNSTWKESDLQYSKLNNLTQLASKPSITALAEQFSHPWLETDNNWTGRYLHMPYMAENGYGKDIAIRTNDAGLSLNLNYTTAQKRDLLVGYVQAGLDNYGFLQKGGTWYADGGHNVGRLAPLIVAAGVLDDVNLKNMIRGSAMKFQEFQTTWIIEQADLTKPQGYWQNNNTLFACENGDPCYRYTTADIGKAEWGIRHTEKPEKDNNYWLASYRDINGGVFVGTSMIAQVMGLRSTVNHEPFFLYAERHIEYEKSSEYKQEFKSNSTLPFQREFYNAYKNTGLTLTSYNLSVGTTEFGTVSVSPAGTSCGTNCYTYPLNTTTQVTLTAIPTGSATFTGWSGGGCTGTSTCTITVSSSNTSNSITANFSSPVLPFAIGNTVSVTASTNINVRSSGGYVGQNNLIGTQPFGQTGTIIGGPVALDGYIWWNINYASGVDGWSGQDNLVVTSVGNPGTTFTLTTSVTGTGSGTFVGNSGIYASGAIVKVNAIPSTGSTFTSWTGCASVVGTECTVSMTGNKTVTANFTKIIIVNPTEILTANIAGTGSGSISGNTSPYVTGTTATVVAIPSTGSTFTSWTGCASVVGTECTVSMTGNKTVTANFTLIPTGTNLLYQNATTLTLDGTTAGTEIAIDDSKITNKLTVSAWVARSSDASSYPNIVADEDYEGDKGYYLGDTSSGTNNSICFRINGRAGDKAVACESSALISTTFSHYVGVFDGTTKTISLYRDGTLVNQRSHPSTSVSLDTGTELLGAGWKGQIKDVKIFHGTLTPADISTPVTMFNLTTSATNGSITRSPNATSYTNGTSITLTATPATNYQFPSWTGCTSTTDTCTVVMDANKTVTATFTLIPVTTYTLTVNKTGTGTGTIAGNASPYTNGTTATLTAVPATGSTFTGWSGACTGTGICTVSMTANKTVTATFNLIPVTSTNLLYQNTNTLTLDGTTAGTEIAVDDSQITNKLTVSAWVARSSDTGSYPSIVADEDYAGNKGYYLGDTSSGTNNQICFRINGRAGDNATVCESIPMISSIFTHYVGVFDGTTQTISLYRDGTLVSQRSHPSTSVSLDTGTEILGAGWKGQIKDVKIYNTVSDGNI